MEVVHKRTLGPIVFGGVLIALGVLFILNNLEIIDFGDVVADWWPAILIGVGLFNMIALRSVTHAASWIPIGFGAMFLLATLDYVDWSRLVDFWPVVLIVIGLAIVFGGRPGRSQDTSTADLVRINTVFNAVDRKVTSAGFRGGDVSAVFGGVDLDLSEATLAEGGGNLRVSAVFGGVELKIPRDWEVSVRPSDFLGETEQKQSQSPQPQGGRLVIQSSAVFGGVEIHN